jgi:hypothetical protein
MVLLILVLIFFSQETTKTNDINKTEGEKK